MSTKLAKTNSKGKTAVKKTAARKSPKKTAKKKAKPSAKKAPRKVAVSKSKKTKAASNSSKLPSTTSVQLLVLSPFRFPMNIDRMAILTARFGGLTMALVGALLTVFYASNSIYGFNNGLLAAQVICVDPNDPLTCQNDSNVSSTTSSSSDPVTNLYKYITDSTQTFSFNPSDPIKGNVRVRLNTEIGARKVYLEAKNRDTGAVIELGSLTKDSDNRWEKTFNSTSLKDGKYKFIALVEFVDNYGKQYVVTISDSQTRVVDNSVVEVTETNIDNSGSGTSTDVGTETDTSSADTASTTKDSTTQVVDQTEADVIETLETESIEEQSSEDISSQTDPKINIEIVDSSPVSGRTPVYVSVVGAEYIELYAKPVHSGTPLYVGLPKPTSRGPWLYEWDTTKVPNGTYELQAKVRTKYGFFTKIDEKIDIKNLIESPTTKEIESYKDTAIQIDKETPLVLDLNGTSVNQESTSAAETQDGSTTADETTAETKETSDYDKLVDSYRDEIEDALQALVIAIRSGNPEAQLRARKELESLVVKVKSSALNYENQDSLIFEIESRINRLVERTEEDLRKTNQIIEERTGQAADTDSDGDGITDYDEIVIFKTDPNVADSDGDGFIDGAEVLSGFDPTNSEPEVAVVYESPKEAGVVREDILSVKTITTEDFSIEDDDSSQPAAIITGQALPNSYVTLYIFSTPIVVTIKTDSDGSWIYRFDRELEDGEHVVYAGITDNAGKIVAKSNPLPFVKRAEAFTQSEMPIPATVATSEPDQPLFSTSIIYLVASVAIVAIGIVLILLGLHLEATTRRLGELKLQESKTT